MTTVAVPEAGAPMRRHTVRGGGGLLLHVREWGNPDGPPILFLHGWSQSHQCWDKQVSSPLLKEFRLVACDLRGHGMSQAPPGPECYTDAGLWADDVAAIVGQLRLGRPVLVGWSYGAFVICDYLRAYGQEQVAAACFAGGAVKLGQAAFGTLIGPGFLDHFADATSDDLPANIRAMRGLVRAFAAKPLPASDVETLLCAGMVVPAGIRASLAAREIDGDDVLRSLGVPLLVSHGRADTIVLPAMAEHVLATCPAAEASWYPGAHAPHLEEPERFNRELAALARRAGRGGDERTDHGGAAQSDHQGQPGPGGATDGADAGGGPAPAAEQGKQGRRNFLTGLAAGAAGVAALGASVVSAQPARASTGDSWTLGAANTAGGLTFLDMTANPYSDPALRVSTEGQGPAVEGDNHGGGPGVMGTTGTGTGVASPGVLGQAGADAGVGVFGTGDIGVRGDSPGATSTQVGVKGSAGGPQGIGVQGTGFKGVEGVSPNYGVYGAGFFGVYGLSPVGAGVYGDSSAAAVPGVLASSQVSGGLALSVQGFAKFSTAGKATVAAGASKVTVTLAKVVATDSVLATVQGSKPVSVKNATASAGKITITLTGTTSSSVTVSYLVLRT